LDYLVNGVARPFRSPHKKWVSVFDIDITDVGVFVSDSFDFEDPPGSFPQHLGWWSDKKPYVWARPEENILGNGFWATNAKFRDWRRETGRGADFLIGTQTHWMKRSPPDKFQVWFTKDRNFHIPY
jgi:hypothetical protein